MNMHFLKAFDLHKNIRHGISTKKFDSMKNEDNSINRGNLENFLTHIELSQNAVCMEQVHSANIEVVLDNNNLLIANTDGLITNIKDIPLCVLTADCLPILFFDPKTSTIGIAHGGRKGIIAGIIKNMIDRFKADFNTNPEDLIVGIGPCIERRCYEVDGEFVDIRKIANSQLIGEGISKNNIENMDICTKCSEENFYSYRRGDKSKRFASVISLI